MNKNSPSVSDSVSPRYLAIVLSIWFLAGCGKQQQNPPTSTGVLKVKQSKVSTPPTIKGTNILSIGGVPPTALEAEYDKLILQFSQQLDSDTHKKLERALVSNLAQRFTTLRQPNGKQTEDDRAILFAKLMFEWNPQEFKAKDFERIAGTPFKRIDEVEPFSYPYFEYHFQFQGEKIIWKIYYGPNRIRGVSCNAPVLSDELKDQMAAKFKILLAQFAGIKPGISTAKEQELNERKFSLLMRQWNPINFPASNLFDIAGKPKGLVYNFYFGVNAGGATVWKFKVENGRIVWWQRPLTG